MNLIIKCRLLSDHLQSVKSGDLAVAGETELRYSLFLGDITFAVGSVDFSTNWGWVPLVDFMACLNVIVKQLVEDAPLAHFEFTESDAKITFRNDGHLVRIASTYADGEFSITLIELAKAVRDESNRLANELCARYPELRRNPVFLSLLPVHEIDR